MADRPATPLILDFGLHQGEDSEFYLACGADVIAFEGNQSLVEQNGVRFRREIAAGQLKLVSGAIVPPDFEGTEQTFYVDKKKSVWGTTSADWVERNSGQGSSVTAVTIPAVNLKAILAELPAIFYAKIDIEGADRFVLDSFRAVGVTPQFVSIESDKTDLQQVIDEIETLQGLGYTKFAAVQQATVPGSYFRGARFDNAPLNYRFRKHASGPFGPYLQQPFKSAGAAIDDYRSIFKAYARYGDRSWPMRSRLLRGPTRALNFALIKSLGQPLCGWYDTHAMR